MDWSQGSMDRLYELYQQHFQELRSVVVSANRSHGSSHPDKSWMEVISRDEFERLLSTPTDEPEIANRWVRRIIRGHEHDFPNLEAA